MLGRVKISTAIYLIALILLAGWLIKTYIDFTEFDFKKLEKVSKEAIQIKDQIKEEISKQIEQEDESIDKYKSTSDGVFLDPQDVDKSYPIAIVVENIVESRPQAGLDKAQIVYEAVAEGGITRFLAIFTDLDDIERIGPIRSARPYFLDWAEGFGDPIFLHVGGSADALDSINRRSLINLDEFYWRDDYYQRISQRQAPHNTYITPELLNKIKVNHLLTSSDYKKWNYKQDAEISQRGDIGIKSIDFSSAEFDYEDDYLATWNYDRQKNNYLRIHGNKIYRLENGEPIQSKNIVVLYTFEEVIDEEGRLQIKTIGKGNALVFLDGKKIDAKWHKKDETSRIRFYDLEDNDIEFNSGQIWIEVVPIGNDVITN